MEAAPRTWQFSLSNWPVTRKVGIVLVLPVLLAATFAVLRINSELQTIAQLSNGSEQSDLVRPTVKFMSATDELAITAIAGFGNQNADPALEAAASKFDQAVAELETQIRATNAEVLDTKNVSEAVAMARTMRNSLRSLAPAAIGDQADQVGTKVQNALATSPSIADLRVQRLFLQMGSANTARRVLTTQRVMLAMPDADRNPMLRTRLLTAIGAELTLIEVYRGMAPTTNADADVLKDAAQTRAGILAQTGSDLGQIPAMQDALHASAAAYDREISSVIEAMDGKLASLTTEARNNVLRDTSIVIGMLLAGLAIALVVARSLVVPVRRLRRDALQVAHIDLPQELEVVRAGGVTPEIMPVDVHTTEEIGQLARAVDDIHSQALHLAAEQARLRLQIGNMFETLSRRSQSLVEQQLSLIEELERDEDDSERLQSLFRLDHLATRMRRNGDNLLVLAGTALRRGHLAPVPLSDMLWSSVSQVEDYQRVEIGTVPDGIVAGEPAVDIEHLLAELIDNALRYSPPSTPVAVSVARAVDGGYLIEITDRGLGMNAEDLQSINDRLASGGEVNVETARRMGLFVVGRLAKRHNITVSLRRTSAMVQQPGITASVHLPGSLVSPAPERSGDPTGQYPVTGALPVAPVPGAPVSGPQPVITPPRLTPVPNLPETTPPQRFGVTSSGLPQRKTPGGDTGEFPVTGGFGRGNDRFTDAFVESTDPGPYGSEPSKVDFWGDNSGAQPEPPLRPVPPIANGGTGDGPATTRFDLRDSEGFGNSEERTGFGANAPRNGFGGDGFGNANGYAGNNDPGNFAGNSTDLGNRSEELHGRDDDETGNPRGAFGGNVATGNFGGPNRPTANGNAANGNGFGPAADKTGGFGDGNPAETTGGFGNATNGSRGFGNDGAANGNGGFGSTANGAADRGFGSADGGFGGGNPAEVNGGFANGNAADGNRGFGNGNAADRTGGFGGGAEGNAADGIAPERGNGGGSFGNGASGAVTEFGGGDRGSAGADAATTTGSHALSDIAAAGEAAAPRPQHDSPIFQRMVSEWLVEPAAGEPNESVWSSEADAGWAAAEEAANPQGGGRTQGGLPIRRPGAQLVPGAAAQEDDGSARNPEEIRNSLTRHLSGVRSGRADTQYTDGGHA
nr:HAMP domain-containing sensor histidine kinase [Nocardia inohanensis]